MAKAKVGKVKNVRTKNSVKETIRKLDTPRNNFYLVTAAVIVLAGFFIYLNPPKKDTTVNNANYPAASSVAVINEVSKPKNIAYKGQEGKTALDLLKADFTNRTQGEGKDAFVVSINGYAPDTAKEFWALYVNGKMSEVGAGSYITHNDDLIEWKLEAIKND